MNHPRLTDSQLRDLQPGDRVSRYSRPGEVQTAPVSRVTDTQIVVLWPDETEARYWRESGTRTNCRGEVLRMPAEEPEPDGYSPATTVEPSADELPVELLTLSTPCPVFYAALGPFLTSIDAWRETGSPIAAGKTRIVATCTPASAAILARLGFSAIGESAGYTTMSLAAR